MLELWKIFKKNYVASPDSNGEMSPTLAAVGRRGGGDAGGGEGDEKKRDLEDVSL